MRVGFYYDVVCPFAYLASTQIQALAARAGARVEFRPILLGGVLRSVGSPDHAVMTAARARASFVDLHRWADHYGVPLRFPPGHPRRTVDAMRLLCGTLGELRENLTHALFQAYWREGLDLTDHAVLEDAARRVGMPTERTREVFGYPDLKQRLRDAVDEAVALGVFGVPSFVIEPAGVLVWGQDRLELVEALLDGRVTA